MNISAAFILLVVSLKTDFFSLGKRKGGGRKPAMILMSMYTCTIAEKGTLVRDGGGVEGLPLPRAWQPVEGQPRDAASAGRLSPEQCCLWPGGGKEVTQKPGKVKRKGLPARAEQSEERSQSDGVAGPL